MKEQVNHPSHYNQYPIEVIDMMVAIWGAEKVADFCELNAFKYRMRVGHKGSIAEDLAKEQWYLCKAAELRAKQVQEKERVDETTDDANTPIPKTYRDPLISYDEKEEETEVEDLGMAKEITEPPTNCRRVRVRKAPRPHQIQYYVGKTPDVVQRGVVDLHPTQNIFHK